ncbi:MarR family winged helix-turn-helix transcriptional regulator [Streptomyces atratus]|uniref:MarR family winged helix-turn-helix transcriptional regulator n=1 Tax=Streptomyces atratus TaxID=1893 RepID=UPI00224FA498|nr:MarR family transcriptional regulator [Streptomyces atratus]MCX5343526.1 MarR family transcriptional regulator [Streptomyces atratus]
MEMTADERLGMDVKRTEQALMAAKSAALKGVGLTVAQYAALFVLAENPGISGAALARACLVTPQAMAAVLKNLEERGLVTRSAHPWHQKMLETRLTDAGRETARLADERAVRIERRLADEFTPQERDSLRGLLARCVTAIEQD